MWLAGLLAPGLSQAAGRVSGRGLVSSRLDWGRIHSQPHAGGGLQDAVPCRLSNGWPWSSRALSQGPSWSLAMRAAAGLAPSK